MPKETIAGDGPFVVKVGWRAGVQVGVEVSELHTDGSPGTLFDSLLGDTELLRLVGGELRKMAELTWEDDEQRARALLSTLNQAASYRGVWADLGRDACNDLIRVLRRARDASYGRDE